jgi:acylphosphatase
MNRIRVIPAVFAIYSLGQLTTAAELPKPPELKVLERFVGTWDDESVSTPAVWTPKEVRAKSMEVNGWALDGWFLQGTGRTPGGKIEVIVMNGYDPVEKTYRFWWFFPGGHTEQWTGKWDEATATLTIKGDLGKGMTTTGSIHFTDDDHHELHFVTKDSDGKVYSDTSAKAVRRKPVQTVQVGEKPEPEKKALRPEGRREVQQREVYFSGRVQGVGFRQTTATLAKRFAVTGFVKNLPDGRVQLVVEGQPKEIESFLAAVRKEMEKNITKTEETTNPATGEFQSFGIRY